MMKVRVTTPRSSPGDLPMPDATSMQSRPGSNIAIPLPLLLNGFPTGRRNDVPMRTVSPCQFGSSCTGHPTTVAVRAHVDIHTGLCTIP